MNVVEMTPVPQLVKNRMTWCLHTPVWPRALSGRRESLLPEDPESSRAQEGLSGSCVLSPGMGTKRASQQGIAWHFRAFVMCRGRGSRSGPQLACPAAGCKKPGGSALQRLPRAGGVRSPRHRLRTARSSKSAAGGEFCS